MSNPEDFSQLQERFAKILGRQPTADESKELMRDKDEVGLSYHDPLLVQLMAFKRERVALETLFRQHREDLARQLSEARDQMLRETDKTLIAMKTEILAVSAQAMQTEQKRLLDEHRTKLTMAVKESTREGVKEKFQETWITEWQRQFSKDWQAHVNPELTRIGKVLHNARRTNLIWTGAALVLSFSLGVVLTVWWTSPHTPLPEPDSPPSSQLAPSKLPIRTRKYP